MRPLRPGPTSRAARKLMKTVAAAAILQHGRLHWLAVVGDDTCEWDIDLVEHETQSEDLVAGVDGRESGNVRFEPDKAWRDEGHLPTRLRPQVCGATPRPCPPQNGRCRIRARRRPATRSSDWVRARPDRRPTRRCRRRPQPASEPAVLKDRRRRDRLMSFARLSKSGPGLKGLHGRSPAIVVVFWMNFMPLPRQPRWHHERRAADGPDKEPPVR